MPKLTNFVFNNEALFDANIYFCRMKRILFIIMTLASVVSLHAASPYLKLVEKADKAIADGKYPEAIEALTKALKLEPDNSGNVMVMSNLGMLNYYQGNDTTAIYYLTMAHEIAPESITILSNRAKVLTETGNFAAALGDLDEICKLDSTLYRPYLSKGVIYLAVGDVDKASDALGQMSSLTDTSKSIECTAALAWLASLKHDNAEAIKQYTVLIDAEPVAEFYASRAICYIEQEEYAEASADIRAGMELDAECAELYVARALLNKRTFRNDDSLKDAQRAVDLGADRQRVRHLMTE